MGTFQFPLRRVLEWRRTQLDLEENKLRHLVAAIEELALAAVRLELVRGRAEDTVRQAPAVESGDFWALAAYRQRLISEVQALAERKRATEVQLTAQRQKVVEAERQYRLLEKLEERRRAEWDKQAERQIESLAAESFLAAWNRKMH